MRRKCWQSSQKLKRPTQFTIKNINKKKKLREAIA
jgi:hypothetical protein